MSYILDALRRADSERERGAVPGIHAQPVPVGSIDAEAPRASHAWVWLSAALAALLLAALAWQWLSHEPAPEPVAATPLPISRPPPPIELAPPPVPTPAPTPAPPAPPVVAKAPLAARAASTAMARKAAPPMASTARAAATPAVAAATAPAASSAAPEARVPTANELPDDIQRGLPALAVGGASYSANPTNRMLIINGQVFREGDKLTPEITLEQIRLKEAVLSTKGVRYRIVY